MTTTATTTTTTTTQAPAECALGTFWCNKFDQAGISVDDQSKVSEGEGVWLYDDKSTKVGRGSGNSACDPAQVFCAHPLGNRFGWGSNQAQAIKAAIDNGGVHPQAPQAPAECALGTFWCNKFDQAGISVDDQSKVSEGEGVWLYDDKSTKVGRGSGNSACDPAQVFCAHPLGNRFGWGSNQAQAIK